MNLVMVEVERQRQIEKLEISLSSYWIPSLRVE